MEEKVDKVENSVKKKQKDVRFREFYEKVFPELRKQREEKERMLQKQRATAAAAAAAAAEINSINQSSSSSISNTNIVANVNIENPELSSIEVKLYFKRKKFYF